MLISGRHKVCTIDQSVALMSFASCPRAFCMHHVVPATFYTAQWSNLNLRPGCRLEFGFIPPAHAMLRRIHKVPPFQGWLNGELTSFLVHSGRAFVGPAATMNKDTLLSIQFLFGRFD